jgi:hypothetical protein
MALTGLGNLTASVLNQPAEQAPEVQTPHTLGQTAANTSNPATPQDQFAPATQNNLEQATAQGAGLFTVSQPSFFTDAAGAFLAQASASQANQVNTASPSATVTSAATAQAVVPANVAAQAPAQAQAPPQRQARQP